LRSISCPGLLECGWQQVSVSYSRFWLGFSFGSVLMRSKAIPHVASTAGRKLPSNYSIKPTADAAAYFRCWTACKTFYLSLSFHSPAVAQFIHQPPPRQSLTLLLQPQKTNASEWAAHGDGTEQQKYVGRSVPFPQRTVVWHVEVAKIAKGAVWHPILRSQILRCEASVQVRTTLARALR
jgi:hypothetical protein